MWASAPHTPENAEGKEPRGRDRKKRARNAVISIIIGSAIVWLLLSEIDPRDVPRAIGNVPLLSLLLAFLLYATSVYLKAVRFKIILRAGISLRQLFPIVSLYMFFANILPMRTGELSYVYLLKKQARTPGTKSFASLIVGGIADSAVILMAMLIVGWHLRDALAEGFSRFLSALTQKSEAFIQATRSNLLLYAIAMVFLIGFIIGIVLLKRKKHRVWHYASTMKAKAREVGSELADVSFDTRLLGIIVCSVLIISFRFGTQWYLVRSMGITIGIWKLSFALLFGVLFSLIPIHGPAGFGTVEAPWVAALVLLDIPRVDAITSGFGLHIIIILYCIILGFYGAVNLRRKTLDVRRET
jgi:uncharacterized protein (TIRG00374 family)